MQFDEFYRTLLRRLKVNLIDRDPCGWADINRGHPSQRRNKPQSKRGCARSPINQAEGNHQQLNCWYLIQSARATPATLHELCGNPKVLECDTPESGAERRTPKRLRAAHAVHGPTAGFWDRGDFPGGERDGFGKGSWRGAGSSALRRKVTQQSATATRVAWISVAFNGFIKSHRALMCYVRITAQVDAGARNSNTSGVAALSQTPLT